MMRLDGTKLWHRIVGLVRRVRIKLIIWAIRKYHPEGLSYDPDYRIYVFRWTKELDNELFKK